MVSMTRLGTTLAALTKRIANDVESAPWPSPETGFLDHLASTNAQAPPNRALVTARLDEAPILAAAGYQYANPSFARPAEYDAEWAKHFKRLAQRQAFPADRETCFYRPLELLGICLGAQRCPALSDDDRRWLQSVLQQAETKLQEHSRAHYLGAAAASHAGVTWTLRTNPRLDGLPLATLSLFYWIHRQPDLAQRIGFSIDEKDLAERILNAALTNSTDYDDLADAGLILNATQAIVNKTIRAAVEETWQAPRDAAAAAGLVRTICERFSIVANTLAKRHNNRATIAMEDEYDVQDLLGALLKLHFTDVRLEEWTPSYGGNASRMDFLLKPEQLVVEAKMTRGNLGQKEVANQLAVDILRYQSHRDCKTLICFVYDPMGKCQSPAALENDLTSDHGNIRVIVIVQPKHH